MKNREHEWDHIAEIASYYGFRLIEVPSLGKDDAIHVRHLEKHDVLRRKSHENSHGILFKLEEKIAILKNYAKETVAMSQPVMIMSRKTGRKDLSEFSLDILGTSRSIAEAILIKTSAAILEEEGYVNISITLNSIGDRDSIGRFERDIGNYYKKKLLELPAKCRDLVRRDPIAFICEHEVCSAIRHDAPQPMAFLSEQARTHFKEVLEFIETLNIPYTIDPTLFGHKECFAHTLFEIKAQDPKSQKDFISGFGFRYNPLSRRLGYKKEIPSISLSCIYEKIKDRVKLKKPKPANFYFIQLGFEAKLKSLKVIETLRKWGIPILHALARDKMTGQLSSAEFMELPFIIIMGQKEAMENSVVVRDTNTRVQETVHIDRLPHYLNEIHSRIQKSPIRRGKTSSAA